jgi:hypothetical protein
MPIDIPGGYGQVIHSMSLVNDPEPMAITYGVKFTGQAPASAQLTVDDLHAVFASTLFGIPHNSYRLEQTEMRYRVAEIPEPLIAVKVQGIQGTGSASPLPQNCAALFHKRSATSGRRHRGRFYLPGLSEGAVDPAGRISAGEITAYNDLALSFLNSVNLSDDIQDMVIFHTGIIGTLPPPTVVTLLNVDPVIATQRRRLRK